MFIGDDEDTEKQRFKLENPGKNELVILGVNPSTARGESKSFPAGKTCDDQTIKKVNGFAEGNWNSPDIKFDGFLMLNVCAQSTSNPDELICDDKLHERNKEKIKSYLATFSKKQEISVLLAYGDTVENTKKPFLQYYLKDIIEIMKSYKVKFYHLGDFTKSNNPRHLLYLSYDSEFNLIP